MGNTYEVNIELKDKPASDSFCYVNNPKEYFELISEDRLFSDESTVSWVHRTDK